VSNIVYLDPAVRAAVDRDAARRASEERRRVAAARKEQDVVAESAVQAEARRLQALHDKLAEYILVEGSPFPGGLNRDIIKQVMVRLAGTDELKDPGVLERFMKMNEVLHSSYAVSEREIKRMEELDEAIHPKRIQLPWRIIVVKPGSDTACAGLDPELFFPHPEDKAGIEAAKEVCWECSLREECLELAMSHNEPLGVWGGLSEAERRSLKRQRAAERRT